MTAYRRNICHRRRAPISVTCDFRSWRATVTCVDFRNGVDAKQSEPANGMLNSHGPIEFSVE